MIQFLGTVAEKLIVIPLCQIKSDKIIRMLTITGDFYSVLVKNRSFDIWLQ